MIIFNPNAAVLQIYVKFARTNVGSAASVFILPLSGNWCHADFKKNDGGC